MPGRSAGSGPTGDANAATFRVTQPHLTACDNADIPVAPSMPSAVSADKKPDATPALAPVSVFVSGLNNPRGLKFGPDGNLYLSAFGNNRVERYTPTGTFLNVFTSGGGLTLPYGLRFGPDGNLYVVSNTDNVIYRIRRHP